MRKESTDGVGEVGQGRRRWLVVRVGAGKEGENVGGGREGGEVGGHVIYCLGPRIDTSIVSR